MVKRTNAPLIPQQMASSKRPCFFGVVGSNPIIHNNKLFQTFPMSNLKNTLSSPVSPGKETAWILTRVCRRLFNFALPKPSSAQSRGATRVSCLRVTWYRTMCYVRACRASFLCLFITFCVLYVFYFFFRLNTFFRPSRGCR